MATSVEVPKFDFSEPCGREEFDVAVLMQVANGETNVEIARILGCYSEDVKRSLARSQRRFGTTDRAGSVGAAFRAGVLQ
jgi:DNA-binding CsgD family transcriptional regulator